MARILFVTSRLPYPPREGHQLRSWHLLRAVARRHEVDLLSLRRPEDPPEPPPALRDVCARVETVPLPALFAPDTAARLARASLRREAAWLPARYVDGALRERFRTLAAGADLVHLDILAVAALQDALPAPRPVVLNQHNVESELLQARAGLETSPWRRRLLAWQARHLAAFEARACRQATRVLACSEVDAERLRRLAPGSDVQVVPNGVDLTRYTPDDGRAEEAGRLVFLGQMGWFPNRDAVEWFAAQIMPRVREQRPAHMVVVGRRDGMPDFPAASGVAFAGYVEDLAAELGRASVFVVPLRAGSGTRLKLLEAMALGKAIVSTRIGAEGLGLVDDEHALLADDEAGFAAAVVRLFDEAPLRRRLGAAARRLAEARYGWDAIGARLAADYEVLLAEPARYASQR